MTQKKTVCWRACNLRHKNKTPSSFSWPMLRPFGGAIGTFLSFVSFASLVGCWSYGGAGQRCIHSPLPKGGPHVTHGQMSSMEHCGPARHVWRLGQHWAATLYCARCLTRCRPGLQLLLHHLHQTINLEHIISGRRVVAESDNRALCGQPPPPGPIQAATALS